MRRNAGLLLHAVWMSMMVLLCRGAGADGVGNVLVLKPMTRIVSSREDLRADCGVSGQYDACTHIIGYQLRATCGGDGTEWWMDAAATFRPLIVLHRPRSLSHENAHIEDIRRAVERHILGLEELRFGSRAECETRTLAASSGFASALMRFAEDSNDTRHPQLRVQARK